MKILFINFQSGMRMVNGHMQYLTSGWKYLFPHNSDGLEDVVTFINREQPDIVSFAEIDDCSLRTKQCNQVDVIGQKTHLEHTIFFPTRVSGKWIHQGNAILSRYPISSSEKIQLPGSGEKRYLCRADIIINKKTLQFFTTHLSTTKKRNKRQRQFIADTMQKINTTAILTGDFNIGAQEMTIIKNQTSFVDVQFTPMFPSWKPEVILDHIFVSGGCSVKKSTTYVNEKFSDHLPIGVECDDL
ncbi:MAG: endonuclease/exonuclease/phosphatase family protein [Patescibacteria group bacterium]|nr:endonuclease/exonuclease/phosphatase family protein [Patescibacteria group bacterium]